MIYCDLKGNLGNQMFIYACARKLQEVTGQKICLSTYNLIKRYKNYHYQLDIFKLNDNVMVSNEKVFPFYATTNSLFYRLFKKITLNSDLFQKLYFDVIKKKNYIIYDGLDEFRFEVNPNKDIYLSGFFQSIHFFEGCEKIIRDDFTLIDNINPKYVSFLEKIKQRESVCVSVRRGDFVSNPVFRKKHFVCDDEYFKRAITSISNKIEKPLFVFFSDEPNWVKEYYRIEQDAIYEMEGLTITEKILLMSNCKNFIVSNSSFSWWIEFLSNNNGITISPSKWYADQRTCNIFRDHWIKIDTN